MTMLRTLTILAFSALFIKLAIATSYTVGGPSGSWDQSTDLTSWASSKTFIVGDSLVFKYTSNHDVLEVSKSDYDSCSTGNAISTDSSGNTVISLSSQGKRYFICGTAGHCSTGMKVEIDTTSGTPAATPAASPPPPKASTPPPSTATPPPEASTPPPSTTTPPPEASTPPPSTVTPPPEASTPPPSTATPPPEASTPANEPESSPGISPEAKTPTTSLSPDNKTPTSSPPSSANKISFGIWSGLVMMMIFAL
jgi:hypothetical protein